MKFHIHIGICFHNAVCQYIRCIFFDFFTVVNTDELRIVIHQFFYHCKCSIFDFFTDGKNEVLVPSIKVKAVETTGAGDAFNGGLATAIAEGLPMDTALKFATCTAAISVTRLGSSPSMPYRHEILELMQKEFGITL